MNLTLLSLLLTMVSSVSMSTPHGDEFDPCHEDWRDMFCSPVLSKCVDGVKKCPVYMNAMSTVWCVMSETPCETHTV